MRRRMLCKIAVNLKLNSVKKTAAEIGCHKIMSVRAMCADADKWQSHTHTHEPYCPLLVQNSCSLRCFEPDVHFVRVCCHVHVLAVVVTIYRTQKKKSI